MSKHSSPNSVKNEVQKVVRKTLKNFIFKGDFHGIEFRNVKFANCEFDDVFGFSASFKSVNLQIVTFEILDSVI